MYLENVEILIWILANDYKGQIYIYIWKMIVWHSFFSYLHLILRRGSVVLRGKERETQMVFWLRGSCLSFCKGCLLSFAIWKMQGNLRGKSRSHFFAFLFPTVEALPFALVVLTLNPKLFWYETCLLCVDVCFV